MLPGLLCPSFGCSQKIGYDQIEAKLSRRMRKMIQTQFYEVMLKSAKIEYDK